MVGRARMFQAVGQSARYPALRWVAFAGDSAEREVGRCPRRALMTGCRQEIVVGL